MDSQLESESPKVDKPPSHSTRKALPKLLNPSGIEGTHVPTGAASNPTSPPAADSRCDAARQSPSPDPAMQQDASPITPKSFGLGAHGQPQPGEGSSVLRSGKQPQQYLRVAESLWDNPDFIQAGFHIGRYMSTSVNTQAEQEKIKVLYSSMQTTSKVIDVSFHDSSYLLTLRPNSSLKHAVVKHSRDKDQLLRVSLKRMQETQMYENELKEANEYISALTARLEELEAKCTDETQLKEGKILSLLYLISLSYPSIL
jgi:hypothetical protein